MKCLSNKIVTKIAFLITILSFLSLLNGCSKANKYDTNIPLTIRSTTSIPIVKPKGMATQNAVISYDAYVYDDTAFDYEAGLLINNTNNSVVTATNPHKQIYPASMTKILTAIVVMDAVKSKQISLSDTVVISKPITFNESDVAALGLQVGDYITVDELMHGLLIASYNDCAVALARYVAGSVEEFVELMNTKAAELGATNSHFVNPHGLHDDNHYTTPYDLYLMFKEFLANDTLLEIDSNASYNMLWYRDSGKVECTITATNYFLSSIVDMPTGYQITGWKTGTTDKAGSCIMLEFINENTEEKYICLVANAPDHDTLYENVEDMLKEIY